MPAAFRRRSRLPSGPDPCRPDDAWGGDERDHQVRWKQEDVGVSDAVTQRKDRGAEVNRQQQQRAAGRGPNEVQEPRGSQNQSGPAELLAHVERVHPEPVGRHARRHAEDHAAAPVGLRHIEPEAAEGFAEVVWRKGSEPERVQIPEIRQRSDGGEGGGEGDRADSENRSPSLPREDEQPVRGRQQNHREVIAEGQGVDGEEAGEPCDRGPVVPAQEEEQGRRDKPDVERIDLGENRLTPERVRAREQARRGHPGGQ